MPVLAETSLRPVPEQPFVWTRQHAERLYNLPFADLLYKAQTVHRKHFDPNSLECAQLLSIKTGGCAEDCAYCSQSAHYKTEVKATKLMGHEDALEAAKQAKANGATRFCMGAAWRSLKDRDVKKVTALIADVKALGLETCVTLGMLTDAQAHELKEAGLDYYNHNLDASPDFYKKIITTRRYEDRLETLEAVRSAGLKVCCGGIIGLGETQGDRLDLLVELATLPEQPHSTPINAFIPAKGTPLQDQGPVDPIAFVKIIATARLMLPKTVLRLSAGREFMSKEMQALCFLAGAGSIFVGDKLLTADNPEPSDDAALLEALGIRPAVSTGLEERISQA